MTLQDLVPPLELCMLIPDGEFADTEFSYAYNEWTENPQELYGEKIEAITSIVHTKDGFSTGHEKNPKPDFWELMHNFSSVHVCQARFPAPTLQEIVEELSRMPKIINPTVWKQGEFWIMDCAYDPSGNLTGMLSEDFLKEEDLKTLDVKTAKDKNPPAAALRLWLELKEVAG